MPSPFLTWLRARWRQRGFRVAAYVLLVILILRLSLAFMIKTGANQVLARMDHYRGHIDGVGLSFLRGAYQFRGVSIETLDGKVPLPLFEARTVDVAIKWSSMLRGEPLASVVLDRPVLNLVMGPTDEKSQYGTEEDWMPVIQQLVVWKIDRLTIYQGRLRFADPYQDPPLDLHLDGMEAKLDGMHQRRGPEGLPCSVSLSAKLMDDAPLWLLMSMDAFAKEPTFEYSVSLENLDLAKLDLLFHRYIGVQVAGGLLSVYSEGRADAGIFKGYVKPIVQGLKVIRMDEKISPGLAKKAIVWALTWVIKDHYHNKNATKIPLSGDLRRGGKGLKVHWVRSVLGWVGNASVRQQKAGLEQRPELHKFQKR